MPKLTRFSLLIDALGPFQRRAAGVLALVVADTTLASLGIGMVLPVFQALMDPNRQSLLFVRFLPFLNDFGANERLIIIAGMTVLLFTLKAAVSLVATYSTNSLLQSLRFHWVTRIGYYYLYGPYKRVAGRKSGELLNDWFNESLGAMRFYQAYVAYLSSCMLLLALVLIGIVADWRIMLGIGAIAVLLALVIRQLLFARSAKLSKSKVLLNQAISASMVEDLTHVRDIKFLQAEAARLNQLQELSGKLSAVFLKGSMLGEMPRIIGEFVAVLILMGLIVLSALLLEKPPAEMLPLIAFFFVAFYRLVSAGSTATASRVRALNEFHSVEVVQHLAGQADEREAGASGLPLGELHDDIVLRDLSYSYDGVHPVLSEISVVIPRGKFTLLVGPSGSGKSTLLDLLMRLTVADQGRIEVNAHDAGDYRLADWRRQFGYVSQEAVLFNGDIIANLRLAAPQATEEDIYEACRLAGADEFIRMLPHGYATIVGDRGHSLSGGQRKRIAIARALIRKPSVLILDEATTSFEQSLEQAMLAVIRRAMPDLTVVQVTHRLTPHDGIDWVIAMQDGRLVAQGNWNQVAPHIAGLYDFSTPSSRGQA